ncbi:MAG TPA: hypothetical protein VGA53_01345 [Candidatus Paceibacterota bacterium]
MRGKTAQALWTEGVGLSLYTAKQFVEAPRRQNLGRISGPRKRDYIFHGIDLLTACNTKYYN